MVAGQPGVALVLQMFGLSPTLFTTIVFFRIGFVTGYGIAPRLDLLGDRSLGLVIGYRGQLRCQCFGRRAQAALTYGFGLEEIPSVRGFDIVGDSCRLRAFTESF